MALNLKRLPCYWGVQERHSFFGRCSRMKLKDKAISNKTIPAHEHKSEEQPVEVRKEGQRVEVQRLITS